MKHIILFLVIAAVLSAPVFSVSIEDLIGAEQAAELKSGGTPLTRAQLKKPVPLLLPRHAELRRLVTETMDVLGPTICVETLSRYPKPVSAKSGDAANWTSGERADLFNQLLALSTLAGIEYYSASRGTMRTFYESSQVIDGPDTKKPLPDPVYSAPPPSLTLYTRQKDLTFGNNIYRYEYRATPDAFFFMQENITAMNAGIIPAVGKNKLRTVLAVIDAEDSLLIYVASMAKAASVPGMGERIGNSFSNRAEAALKWFTGKADGVFGK